MGLLASPPGSANRGGNQLAPVPISDTHHRSDGPTERLGYVRRGDRCIHRKCNLFLCPSFTLVNGVTLLELEYRFGPTNVSTPVILSPAPVLGMAYSFEARRFSRTAFGASASGLKPRQPVQHRQRNFAARPSAARRATLPSVLAR